nr:olfactory receptor 8H1-like [Dasypus novemcinctus]
MSTHENNHRVHSGKKSSDSTACSKMREEREKLRNKPLGTKKPEINGLENSKLPESEFSQNSAQYEDLSEHGSSQQIQCSLQQLNDMGNSNNTNVFILMGLTDSEEIGQVLFILFLLIYLLTMLGNVGMILIIHLDFQLHTPMYFFISHLSFLDLSYSTVITPKTLENLLTSNKYISFMGCFTQMYFFVSFFITDIFLLSSMAYDRYAAICKPLHYQVFMSRRLCHTLITCSYLFGFTESLVNILYMNSLHFCKSNVIYHFFCDLTPILALSCTDTHDTEIMVLILSSFNAVVSLISISISYASILFTILKINSTSGKHKAFLTCASHLLVVTIFYGTAIFTYLKPKNSYSLGKDQVASVFYTMVIPMLNPLIYSLRNKEVKNALIRFIQKR